MPQVAEDNFDDPNLLDFELLLKNVTEIQSGRPTLTPVYSFQFSARTGFVTTPVPQSKVLIVEGTYALKAILRPVYDIAISVTGLCSQKSL
jgi:uridine kinase